jgi:hypothetical protein
MITCCANPACSTAYRDTADGQRRFVTHPGGLEFFWLCPTCAHHYHLSFDSGARVRLRQRPETGRMSLVQLPQNEIATHTTF